MADMMSILSSNYLAVGENISSNSTGKYVPVDPDAWQGTWTGQYGDGKPFTVQISNVDGFRAKVKYQSGATTNYGDVLIKNNSFRIGDSRFDLASAGTGVMSTVITDPATGSTSVQRAYATQG
jgi:hypothetical protein